MSENSPPIQSKGRLIRRVIAVLVAVSLLGILSYRYHRRSQGSEAMGRLFSGDSGVVISRLELSGHGRHVMCIGSPVCDEFSAAFRKSRHEFGGGGYAYSMDVQFSDGLTWSGRVELFFDGIHVCYPPNSENWPYELTDVNNSEAPSAFRVLDFCTNYDDAPCGKELIVSGDEWVENNRPDL